MIIYLDLIIGSTILVNYSFLKTIKLVFNEKKNSCKMALAILLSVLSLAFFFISDPIVISLKYIFGILISIVAFDMKDKKVAIIKTVIFYLMNFAFIGSLVIFKIYKSWLMILAIFYVILLIIIESYKKLVINTKQLVYNVNIKGLIKSLKGFLDTGNQSIFEGVPIVFVNEKYFNDSFTYLTKTNIETINKEKLANLYQGGDLLINNKQYHVYYVFINLKEYDVLLNLLLF